MSNNKTRMVKKKYNVKTIKKSTKEKEKKQSRKIRAVNGEKVCK